MPKIQGMRRATSANPPANGNNKKKIKRKRRESDNLQTSVAGKGKKLGLICGVVCKSEKTGALGGSNRIPNQPQIKGSKFTVNITVRATEAGADTGGESIKTKVTQVSRSAFIHRSKCVRERRSCKGQLTCHFRGRQKSNPELSCTELRRRRAKNSSPESLT
jgi:hypothetical protein